MSSTKRTDLFFALFLVPLDFFLFILAGLSAYYIRFAKFSTEIRPIVFELPLAVYIKIVLIVALVEMCVFAVFGLYRVNGFKKRLDELKRIIGAVAIGFFLIILFLFFTRELFSSRFILLAAWFLTMIYVAIGRLFVRAFHNYLYQKNIGVKRALIIGSGKIYEHVKNEIEKNYALGYVIVATFPQLSLDLKKSIFEFVRAKKIDEVIVLDSSAPKELLLELYDVCDEYNIVFSFSADFFGMISPNFFYNTISNVPIIELRRTPLFGWGRIIKRLIDISGSIVALVFLNPLFLGVAIAIKLESRGPIIYKNRRVGLNGDFDLYKFRYMKLEYCTGDFYGGKKAQELEQQLIKEKSIRHGPLYKIKDDPRKTKVGAFIEKLSIDELPQFWNVLKGDMSLVGPRPHQPREVAQYLRIHKKVFAIKPGITGMGQISGRSDLDFDDEVRLDLFYIEHWSIWLDFMIMFKTPFAILRHRKNI